MRRWIDFMGCKENFLSMKTIHKTKKKESYFEISSSYLFCMITVITFLYNITGITLSDVCSISCSYDGVSFQPLQ